MLKLARCVAPPLCNWAPEITAALRIIATEEVRVIWDLIPIAGEGEGRKRPSMGLFEHIINGVSTSCKYGPLPVDSFIFIFPVPFFFS